jgi:hypothetical protein
MGKIQGLGTPRSLSISAVRLGLHSEMYHLAFNLISST